MFGIALFTAIFLFFAVLIVKVAYFKFIVEKMLESVNADWQAEAGMWNETKQIHALVKAYPDARTVRRNATLLFQAAMFLFLIAIMVFLAFILGI